MGQAIAPIQPAELPSVRAYNGTNTATMQPNADLMDREPNQLALHCMHYLARNKFTKKLERLRNQSYVLKLTMYLQAEYQLLLVLPSIESSEVMSTCTYTGVV